MCCLATYSTDDRPLSTARLYTLTQPGHSLWGVSEPNPFRADCLVPPRDLNATNGKVCGRLHAFKNSLIRLDLVGG